MGKNIGPRKESGFGEKYWVSVYYIQGCPWVTVFWKTKSKTIKKGSIHEMDNDDDDDIIYACRKIGTWANRGCKRRHSKIECEKRIRN